MLNLSIIIPVYNIEKYLKRCIESVLNLRIDNYEIILVDDGSTDGSGHICDYYCGRYDKIKVIHKVNGGLSDARNCGIESSKGDYIAFLDGDDFIKENSYESMLYEAVKNDLDIVVGNAIKYISEDKQYPKLKERSFNKEIMFGKEFIYESLKQNTISMCAPFNIYRRRLIINESLYFKNNILHEDEQWTPRVFLVAKRVKYLNINFYMHFYRENSITNKSNKKQNGIDLVKTCYELSEYYSTIHEKKLSKLLNNYLVMLYLNAIFIGKLQGTKYCDKKFVLKKGLSIKNRIKSILFIISPIMYIKINSYSKGLE